MHNPAAWATPERVKREGSTDTRIGKSGKANIPPTIGLKIASSGILALTGRATNFFLIKVSTSLVWIIIIIIADLAPCYHCPAISNRRVEPWLVVTLI
ncbi:hypothetical protein LZ32DRAFT_358336 [Colletotrichum eremochloae]|nr:hypothetical protein LZ32DRAFT_358336 [Colletotrichum eremochloae]